MTEYHVGELAHLQCDDGRRATLAAAAALKCIAKAADNPELQATVSRLHSQLASIADELGTIKAAMRVKR